MFASLLLLVLATGQEGGQVDANGNGKLDPEEMRTVLDSLKMTGTDEELAQVMSDMDLVKEGVVTVKDYQEWYAAAKDAMIAEGSLPAPVPASAPAPRTSTGHTVRR